MFVPLTYFEVFGRHPTRENLSDFVRALPWQDVVCKCSAVALLSWQRGIETSGHQNALVDEFLRAAPPQFAHVPALLSGSPPRLLFTRETLLALLRLATVYRSTVTAPDERSNADAFLRAALAANEFISNELLTLPLTQTASDLLTSELRSTVIQIENPHVLLGRTKALFDWSQTPQGAAHHAALPIVDDFERFTGLSPLNYLAGAYLVMGRTVVARTFPELYDLGVVFKPDVWLRNLQDSRVPRAWVEYASIAVDAIRPEWAAEPSLSFPGAGTLYRKPLLRVEDDDLYLTPTPDLIQNAMGDGIYFTLLDGYTSEQEKQQFAIYYGGFFEDYVSGIFERGFTGRAGVVVRREFEYRAGAMSSDVVVYDNGDVYFVEVVAKRMNLVGSVLRLNRASIEVDLERGIKKKVKQLRDNIGAFRENVLFPDLPRVAGQRIFPILVAPRAWPRVFVIDDLLPRLEAEGVYPQEVEPIEFLDVGEIESLEGDFAGGLRLGNVLARKNRGARHNRFMTLNNYLIDVEPQTASQPNRALERGGVVASEIINLVTSWGFTADGAVPSPSPRVP